MDVEFKDVSDTDDDRRISVIGSTIKQWSMFLAFVFGVITLWYLIASINSEFENFEFWMFVLALSSFISSMLFIGFGHLICQVDKITYYLSKINMDNNETINKSKDEKK